MLKIINKHVNFGLRLITKFLFIILVIPSNTYSNNMNDFEIYISKCKKISSLNIMKIKSIQANIIYIKKDDINHNLLLCGLSVGTTQIKIWRADNWEMESITAHVKPLKKIQSNAINRRNKKNYPKNEFLLEKKIAGWEPLNK